MKKNTLYLYLYSNEITIYYNGNIYNIKSKSIEDSTIKNVPLFKQEIANILKKYRINYGLVSDNITYINLINTYLEIEYIKSILNEFGFKKINVIELSSYLDKNTYIIVDKNKIYFIKEKIMLNDLCIDSQLITLFNNKIINEEIRILKYNNKGLINQMHQSELPIFYIYNPGDIIFEKIN